MEKSYFLNDLNYSFANEDISVERQLVNLIQPREILSVCGSGLRALALLGPGVRLLDLVDLSSEQLKWGQLRAKLLKNLSFDQYLSFWRGELPQTQMRQLFQSVGLAPEISSNEDLLLSGRWERTILNMAKVVDKFVGRELINHLVCDDLEKQKEVYFSQKFRVRWQILVFLMGNKNFFNALLYRGDFVKKSFDKSYYQYYTENFDKLFSTGLVKDNYFLQLFLLGDIIIERPISPDFQYSAFNSIQNALNSNIEINWYQDELLGLLQKRPQQYDYLSLSDVPSYFGEELGKSFVQTLKPSVKKNGVVVIRYYLNIHVPNIEGFEDITKDFDDILESEKVGVYHFQILRRK